MAAYAGYEGVVWGHGLSRGEQELFPFGAGEEEGFGVCAEDYETGEGGLGEVGVVCGLGGEVEGIIGGVEESYRRGVDAGLGDRVGVFVGGRGSGGHD